MASLTWLGHASFRLDTDGGKRIYVDPWVSGPTCPESEKSPSVPTRSTSRTATATTPATSSHCTQKLGCKVLGMVELAGG